jgi:hypothetical protein
VFKHNPSQPVLTRYRLKLGSPNAPKLPTH